MPTVKMIIFPYGGFDRGSEQEKAFWSVVELCEDPVVILNVDTKRRGKADAYLKDPRSGKYDTKVVWSVDTCQMWLAGWGYILEKMEWTEVRREDQQARDNRIVQLPGDIERRFVSTPEFQANLRGFLLNVADIAIGDFSTSNRNSAKELIDTYGTYPLLANWFPEIYLAMKSDLDLYRPRSEFLNIRVGVLNELLANRKFAYEQTLNMLIRSYDWKAEKFKYVFNRVQLGTIEDDKSFRAYEGCLDQIERTERLIKVVWREIKKESAATEEQYKEFIDRYHALDRSSASIRESARITIRSLLSTNELKRTPRSKQTHAITNEKVAAVYPEWAPFAGVSLLFDNPGNGIVREQDLYRLECRVDADDALVLYKLLSQALGVIGREALANTYSFRCLPNYSYHVTAWDGANVGNLSEIAAPERQTLENYIEGLPNSLQEDNEFTKLISNFQLLAPNKTISFRFAKISKWGNQVLVAELTPSDNSSQRVLKQMCKVRTALSDACRAKFGIPAMENYSPHVSLGYFTNEEQAKPATARIDEWSETVSAMVSDSTITFSGVSLYGFTDMVTFLKRC
jgi:hypothetical protein